MTTGLLPAALLDPAAYPHHPDAVELRETHISWVFLAGDRVYKVKKPVTFPFLDYGSLAQRRTCCHEEVRLNRRFAPDIYVGVVSIVARGPGRLAIAPASSPLALEYAVEMRRYDERTTLAAQMAAGSVSAADLVDVGRAVARFHAAASPKACVTHLPRIVEETVAALDHAGVPLSRLDGVTRFLHAELRIARPELEAREHAGLVRDGHGDLRAEHILCGAVTRAVDGLEFDARLRVADVAYDFAFLVMDVARRDDELARALVRGYRTAGGDAGDDRLLGFLCCMRALVRAKVDLLRAGQLRGAAADDRAARANELLTLAERFAWRVRLPRVVCVAGHAASGKSTLAEALATAAGRPLLSSDRTRKLRAGVDPHRYAGADAYGDSESQAVYAELGVRAAAAVRRDGGVVVDATFRRPQDCQAFVDSSGAAASAAWIVCEAPNDVLLARAEARSRHEDSVSDAGPTIVATELARYPQINPPHEPLARIETTRPVPELLDALAAKIDAAFYARHLHGAPDGGHTSRGVASRS